MAVDGLNLRGSGVIYDTRGSVNQYLKQAQQNQARHQAEQKALADDMAKVKIDGVRQPDVPEYTSKYNEWKGLYGDIQKEKSLEKKAALKRQFDEKELELQELVQDSKTLGKGEQALNAIFLDPSKRENFADDAVTRYQQSKTLSRKDPRYIRDLTTFERKVDVNKVLNELEKDDDVVLKSSKWNNPVEVKHRQGNKDGVLVTQERVIDPNMQAERYDAKWNADNDFKVALKQLYPDIAAQVQDPVQQKQALITQLVNDRIKREPAKPVFKENQKEDNWREKALFNDALIRARKGVNSEGIGTSQPIVIPYGSGTQKGNVKLDEYIPISISKKNFAGSEYIDLKTGKPAGKLKSSNDYEIVGVGNAPVINTGNFKDAISQPDFARNNPNAITKKPIIHVQVPASSDAPAKDYFIPYDRLPENVKQSKAIQTVLSGFKPATGAKNNQQSKPKKSIKGF